MNIPASVLHEQLKAKIVEAVNTCQLPPFIVEDVLRGVLTEVSALAAKQLQADREVYESSLKEEGEERADE